MERQSWPAFAILDEIKTHKPESKKAPKLTLCFKNLL
jgi:hypothetical protein